MPIIPTRAVPLLLAAALFCGAATGCGGDPATDAKVASLADDAVSSSGATGPKKPLTEEEILEASKKYAACMREHGVDMPDPTASSAGGEKPGIAVFSASSADGSGSVSSPMAAIDEASKACAEFIADIAPQIGEIDPEAQEKMLEQARAFAKCMREHGVDMPDPQASPGGGMTQALTISPDDPSMETAQAACATEGGPTFTKGSDGGATTGGFSVGGAMPAGAK